MADLTRIFVCYKKLDADGNENNFASQLKDFLKEVEDYEVWMDEGLDAGVLWEKTIYENLIPAHVVILAIGDGTSESEWVRREVSLAMAFGIQIIPIGLNISEDILYNELKNMGLTNIHYRRPFNMSSPTARGLIREIGPAIENAKKNTESGGHELIKKISKRIERKVSPAKPSISRLSVQNKKGAHQFNIHIASGDIFRLSGFDILVNSENDYMQMARIFDMASISSNLRHFGSAKAKGFLEDTIQSEIEFLARERPRPVPPATTFVTSSGGPTSNLYRSIGVSHIIHVAAVQAVLAENKIVPLQSEIQLRDCIAATFSAVQDLVTRKGIVSPTGSAQRELQERKADTFRPTSIVLPLFGTGRGGKSSLEVGQIIVTSIMEFFESALFDPELMTLTDIHVSAYTEDDVQSLATVLSGIGT